MRHPSLIRVPLAQSPGVLVIALAAGAGVGAWVPLPLTWLGVAGQAYLAVLNLLALPLIVLSVWSGLHQWPGQPQAGLRVGGLLGLAVGTVLAGAFLGVIVATLTSAGQRVGGDITAAIGRLAFDLEPIPAVDVLSKHGAVMASDPLPWDAMVPDNGYRALAYGTLGSALIGMVFFGWGLAAQGSERNREFLALAQGIQRSLETLAEQVHALLPWFAFALAASVVKALGLTMLAGLLDFLWPFALVAVATVGVAIVILCWRSGHSLGRVVGAMRVPMVVCVFSSGPAAAMPSLIDAMCNQLGLRRDLMELAAPLLPVFVRLGDAVFFGVLIVFVANLYGRPLGAADLVWIALAATAAALVSVALASGWSLASAGLLLGWLRLPFEALLPTFALLEVLTAGLRTVMSVGMVAPLVALVSSDLMTRATPIEVSAEPSLRHATRYSVSLRPRQALVLASVLALALGTACLAGVGFGLREAASPMTWI